jgi:hypothetical protein
MQKDDVQNLAVSFLNVDMSNTSPMHASDKSFSLRNTFQTIKHYIHLLVLLLPLIIPIDILFVSVIVQSNLKGFVYIGFLMASYVIRIVFYMILAMFRMGGKQNVEDDSSFATKGYNCGLSVYILSFTFAYICTPMFFLKNVNVMILALLLFFIVLDVIYKHWNLCQFSFETVFNILGGMLFGFLSCFLMYMGGSKAYLFFSEVSSKEMCSVPQKQKFKCNVFKNGEMVKP